MWGRSSRPDHASTPKDPEYSRRIDGKPIRGTWFEPGWRATAGGGAVLLAICLVINLIVLIWASVKPELTGVPKADDNPVLFGGSCDEVDRIKTWSHLAINIVSTLILSTSTVCMQCLSAPTREEVDAAHRKGKWLDVGILSTRNLAFVGPKRIALYIVLGLSSIPLHVFYNSVIFTTAGTYDSLAVLATKDFASLPPNFGRIEIMWDDVLSPSTSLRSETSYLDKYGPYVSLQQWSQDEGPYATRSKSNMLGLFSAWDPWGSAISVQYVYPSFDDVSLVINRLANSNRTMSISECLTEFAASPLTKVHNVAIVTTAESISNRTLMSLEFNLAPGQSHWGCNKDKQMYNSTDLFFASCHEAVFPASKRQLISQPQPEADPMPYGYWAPTHCVVEDVPERCTIVFAKSLMAVIVIANAIKLVAIIYTVKFLDFQPCITVGDMVASFLRRPDLHTKNLRPTSNLEFKEAYRYEVSRILSLEHPGISHLIGPKADLHEERMHQSTWIDRQQRWRSAASARRWTVTLGLWIGGLIVGTTFVALQTSPRGWATAWAPDIGAPRPDFVIPDVSPTGQALLSQTVLANLPQIFLSIIYVVFQGTITAMLSARELANFAVTAKAVRVSPPKVGHQRSSYFLQVPYKFAFPVLAVMTLLHWLISQSVFLVRLDEYDILGDIKNASFESVLGYSLRGTFASVIVGLAMLFYPIALGFFKLPSGVPLISHNSAAIAIACHPFPDEPERPDEKPLRYGLVRGTDANGVKRTRIGFSAGEVEPLKGGEVYEDPQCLSTFLFLEHGLEHTCTMERNSFHMFTKVMKGRVKMT